MAQGVRGDFFVDIGRLGQAAQHDEHHLAREAVAAPVQEKYVGRLGFYHYVATAPFDIVADASGGNRRHGHHALFVPFASHDDIFVIEGYACDFQVDKFRNTQAASVKGLYDGAVAFGFCGRGVDGVDYHVDFLDRQHVGQRPSQPGCFKKHRGVVVGISGAFKEFEECLYAA